MSPRPLTVRLSPKAERLLSALSRRRGQTRSDVVREAIEYYAAGGETETANQGAFQQWADVIGVIRTDAVRTGGRKAAKTTGELFTEIVAQKARARRSR
jgi:predicted transcriptional regulator